MLRCSPPYSLSYLLAVGLQWLLWQTLRGSASRTLINGGFFLTGLLLFSPCQFENWLWGYQLSCFLLNFTLIAGVVVMCLRLPLAVQFLLAATCAIIATFSAGNGMLLWPLLWSINFLRPKNKTRLEFFIWSGAWLLLAVCAVGFYVYDYRKPTGHPPLAASHKFFDYLSAGPFVPLYDILAPIPNKFNSTRDTIGERSRNEKPIPLTILI